MLFFLFAALLATALANPLLPQAAEAPVPQIDASYLYAIDVAKSVTTSQFSCLYKGGYPVAFVRGYKPDSSGSFDSNVVSNIKNAYSEHVGTEVYMTPQPKSKKNATQQVDELYNGLTKKGITVRSLWLQVTSPVNWDAFSTTNINFIQAVFRRFRNYGITPGVYTSTYDWSQITGNWVGAGNDVMLWYWNVYSSGISGETYPDFGDFRPFGGFNSPSVKQFAQSESVCKISPVNRNVFTNSNLKMKSMVSSQGPIVGGYIH